MPEAILPWQTAQWQHLQSAREEGRLAHALLLSGPAGIGKIRFARVLMQWLVCEQPQVQGACGKCRNCHFGLDYPDLHVVEPPEGKRQIAVDQVRELVDICARTAHGSQGRKVVLIHPADAMNTSTANALLKTLEEPSGDTVLILLSDEPARLLATIRSRCQQLNFPVPPKQPALDWLAMSIPDINQREMCLTETGGRPLAAQALFETDGLAARTRCDDIIVAWTRGEMSLAQTYEALKDFELEFVLEWLSQRLHALLLAVMGGDTSALNASWMVWVSRSAGDLLKLQESVLQSRAQLKRGVGLNRQLTLESVLLDWRSPPTSATGLGL